MIYLIVYLILMNLLAFLITAHDKIAAANHRRRVPEFTLMLISALGGAPAMYVTMLIIRHKTRKPLFMIGIPLVFLLELAAAFAVAHYAFHVI